MPHTDLDHRTSPVASPPYGSTAAAALPEAVRREMVQRLEAAGLPYPMDLAEPARPVPGAVSTALHLRMRDGVRLAVDVHVPPAATAHPVPTCLRSTRYWRSTAGVPAKAHLEALEVARWLREGFALVLVDVRGTGASFGTWRRAWDDDQRDDLVEVLGWVVAQPWSDGTVGGYGTSYDGTTAHLLAATGHPAVRAVVPRFGLYDSYADIAAPGGVALDSFLEAWAAVNWTLDGHPDRATVDLPVPVVGSVQPVDDDVDGALLVAAQCEHADNWDLWRDLGAMQVREDLGPAVDLGNGTPRERIVELREARVPQWLWSGWYDGAYAAAALRQLADPGLDVRVTIGPFAHGASMTPLGDPLRPHLRNIAVGEQVRDIAGFLRHRLTGQGGDPSPAALRYYRLGDGWHETSHWPPPGTSPVRHQLAAAGAARRWRPDPAGSSGRAGTRWHTLLGGVPVEYSGALARAERRLAWEGPVQPEEVGVTGTPVLHLDLVSSVPDFALHAYLEAVLPDDELLYLTEGVLRASHRHLVSATTTTTVAPTNDQDERPLRPGVAGSLQWELLPISVLLPAGSRLRVALAGADTPLFRRVPAHGDVVLEVLGTSWIDLPLQLTRPARGPWVLRPSPDPDPSAGAPSGASTAAVPDLEVPCID